MNHVFDDPEILARLVARDVFSELTQITSEEGFNTDLGLNPIILESADGHAKVRGESLVAILDGTHPTPDYISMPLVVVIPLNGKKPRVRLNDVIQDVNRVLEGLRICGYAQKIKVITSTYSRTSDNLVGLLRLRIGVAQKGATK